MFKALDINTRAIIATGADRPALMIEASSIAGEEGYCIQPVAEPELSEFFSVDSGQHRTILSDGRII
ncbi:hypothetical protein ACOI1H_19205 [Loktanella sp. DJP18]|uniref:hypothetical protein n=1 Tax=Loktanella sp. DJP18 TaxID=3409788 RepID=UPI003BB6C8FE